MKIDNIEQYERRHNLEFIEIPENNKEDVVDIVIKVGQALGVNLKKISQQYTDYQLHRTASLQTKKMNLRRLLQGSSAETYATWRSNGVLLQEN